MFFKQFIKISFIETLFTMHVSKVYCIVQKQNQEDTIKPPLINRHYFIWYLPTVSLPNVPMHIKFESF